MQDGMGDRVAEVIAVALPDLGTNWAQVQRVAEGREVTEED